ncbi:hypothetical protein COCOR_06793 [Corallococcus coralloides DSM 2259]|uniref:Uncharacterized protein n=2 Tax=Corallococcus coralloides TaxID=184914 RepID=H8MZF7_CORCM|nr:hypothetical protein COCOR_06793 [Corallococcus coralloides DSM 2259]
MATLREVLHVGRTVVSPIRTGASPMFQPPKETTSKKHRGGYIQQTKDFQKIRKPTLVTGKRIGGALRAEFARQQKRRDSR